MEHVKPGYVAPMYPVQPMPMPMPAPMPAPMPMPMPIAQPPAPIMHKPVHNDIHLHASYQHTSVVFPKPAVVAAVSAPAAVKPCSSAGSILVLFILLVIISRGLIHHKC
ncbi:hypothetical protein GK047_24795 [Paenibacillus sp. SYP-B3998]|uniref:Uncharacterized protein n=1 Tax=Paenibacillus sp. SYP-B3998 TaxID=2678564 RepID=A0A6G4A481_9BACL|nr:hypothetical protein [Paenibacillus sp. SYP-B3998]NEW09195.1 hypothetical protein [Paenibacillus sp. SYP-B3998]